MPHDRAARTALQHFVLDKQAVRAAEVILCVVYWLTERLGVASVTARDIRAWYPADLEIRRLRSAGDTLRLLRNAGLVALASPDGASPILTPARATPLTATGHRLTAQGQAVVEALPDRELVGALRGMRGAAPGGPRAAFRPMA